MTGYVYAIQSAGLIKLGWSSDPRRRIWEIRSGENADAELLGFSAGTKAHEQELHELCDKQRVRGEWFLNEGPVSLFVGHLLAPRAYAETLFAPIESRHLTRVSEVIRALGGTKPVMRMFSCRETAVSNWRVWNAFPANTYLAISAALDRIGVTADPSLWNFVSVETGREQREPAE